MVGQRHDLDLAVTLQRTDKKVKEEESTARDDVLN